ncbi:Phage tail fibre repeat-containing protein [Izhakiella capsodis]|uniref:Phage tail fibre repeat-containing protein n=1 Tax=Izhakiella capsodis TaxID=1367852 RepID=A0A1I5BC58_9GAMM|nr:phage tail protein [Izhakiella capsodis]SFN72318.1 Phage tail fibre repeat-containing protein [Izhakiella capsodis]
MALTLLVSNNANSVLSASINATSTTLSVNTGAGSLFPAAVEGQSFFKLTIIDAATGQLNEIVHVTARNGDVFTILRGQEGTVARAWSANDIVANMLTAGTIRYLIDGITNLPVASLTQAGITQLSSATNSDAENVAATPKAVKDALANVGNVKTVNTLSPDNAGNVQLTASDVSAYSKSESDGLYIPKSSIGVNNGQVMTVNARYPSENNLTTAFMSGDTPGLSSATGEKRPSLEVSNNGNKYASAALMFHREGDFATYFGLDTDNALAIGGYSLENARYRIFHEGFTGNLSTQTDAQNRANAAEQNAKNYTDSRISAVTNTASKSDTGWFKDTATGMMFQWGTVGLGSDVQVAFPVAFPTACISVQMTQSNSTNGSNSSSNISATSRNKNGFISHIYTDEISADWLAIGY